VINGGKHFQQITKVMPSLSDQQAWLALIEWNIKTKSRIVESDFTEAGERKLLNLGHTIGHALESWSHDASEPVAHGHAIAWGLVIETQLAIDVSPNRDETKALQESLYALVAATYPPIPYNLKDIPQIMNYIRADKKNQHETLLFSLAFAPGNCQYNIAISEALVIQVLNDFAHDSH
jgi:3-dehydroquinate synthase